MLRPSTPSLIEFTLVLMVIFVLMLSRPLAFWAMSLGL